MATIWILIASIGDQRYLAETLDSINFLRKSNNSNNYNITTVVSLHHINKSNDVISNRGVKDTPNVIIYNQDLPLSQFQHYNFLADQLSIANDDIVVVCDDDDIFLPNAFDAIISRSSFVGLQILFNDRPTSELFSLLKEHPEVLEAFTQKLQADRIVDDLSGTTTSGRYFKEYFTIRKDDRYIVAMLEDTNYMNYIESLPNIIKLQTPIIIHRLKSRTSLWLQRLADV